MAEYNGPANMGDGAEFMTLDSSGNVYVTGRSEGIGTDNDYATIKYDPLGKELWVVRYNGPENEFDYPFAIVTDSFGNVYVTGRENLDTNPNYATIAYNSSGSELWVARYDGPGNGNDLARDLAIDSFGNIYVTGDSVGTGTSVDFATVAYDSNGTELWVMRYNSPGNGFDGGWAIATDSSGNVYVTGTSSGSGTDSDFCTIKYSQEKPMPQPTINIDPNTLNLKSKGQWITCYITLNNPYHVNHIDISTVLLEDTIPADWGDIQGETLMVKFDRAEVEDMLSPGTYNLKVTGELMDGTEFEGYSDEIRVIKPP